MPGFVKAEKKNLKLRIALDGVTGAGKTYTALMFACAIAKAEGKRVAFIDTERSSGLIYADKFDFDHMNLSVFSPDEYIKALGLVDPDVYAVVVVDSLSHAWNGTGGVLDIKDKATQADKYKDSFGAWRVATPKQNALIDALLAMPTHVIVTMRSKMEYVKQQDEKGYTKIVKMGLAPVQREGVEYEFDFIADLEQKPNQFIVSKSRYGNDGLIVERASEKMVLDMWTQATHGVGLLNRILPTKENLIAHGGRRGLTAQDIAKALADAKFQFDADRWDEMITIVNAYAEAKTAAPAETVPAQE